MNTHLHVNWTLDRTTFNTNKNDNRFAENGKGIICNNFCILILYVQVMGDTFKEQISTVLGLCLQSNISNCENVQISVLRPIYHSSKNCQCLTVK